MCTFAYVGPVETVRLVHFGVGLPDDLSFEPVDDSDWWVLPLAVPDGSRVEYKLEVVDSWGQHLVDDPLNPNVATNPFGANSVCEAHGYEPPLCVSYADDVPRGTFRDVHVSSAAFGRDVSVTVYEPAALANGERAPLLVVHDGGDYLRYAGASTVLDNLIHGDVIPPTFAAFVHPGERLAEYADDPRHATFLTDELVPRLEAELPLLGTPDGRCLMGASFGAVASLAAARRAPGTYGRLLLQSGSFAGAGVGCRRRAEPLWRPVRRFVQDYLAEPGGRRREGVRQLRGVRVADLREPGSRAGAEGHGDGGQLRGDARRPQLGVLAGQSRDRASLAARRRRLGSPPVADVRRRIGLSLGADLCWPICYEEILRRLDLAIPLGDDTIRFDVDRVTIEPFDLRQPVERTTSSSTA